MRYRISPAAHKSSLSLLCLLLTFYFSHRDANAATITVGGGCELDEAVESVNLQTPVDGCQCEPGNEDCASGTIERIEIPPMLIQISSELIVDQPVEIVGSGIGQTIIESVNGTGGFIIQLGASEGKVFISDLSLRQIEDQALSITGITVRGEMNVPHEFTIHNVEISEFNNGGMLFTGTGTVGIINNSLITNNTNTGIRVIGGEINLHQTTVSENEGAGIRIDDGRLTLTRSRIENNDNATFGSGGGVAAIRSELTVSLSIITGNSAGFSGGGLHLFDGGSLSMEGSTIVDNTAISHGGGLNISDTENGHSTSHITNSTFSGNVGEFGGGIKGSLADDGTLEFHHVTIAFNEATDNGGGAYIDGSGQVTYKNTILAKNTAGNFAPDVSHENATAIGSLIGIDEGLSFCAGCGIGNQIGISEPLDPLLGPLTDLGHLAGALVHPLLPGSPAIDMGQADLSILPFDQSGFPRPIDGDGDLEARFDIGAVEFAPTLEAEGLQVDEVSGGAHSTPSNGNYSGGAYAEFNSFNQGSVTYGFSVDASGEYNLRVRIRTGPDRGLYQASIATGPDEDFINLNSDIDYYTPSESFTFVNLGNVDFPVAGPKQLRFTRVGQNNNSSNDRLYFDALYLSPLDVGLSPPLQTILLNHFTSDAEGFSAQDDLFRGTGAPGYANSLFDGQGGLTGGGLVTTLGGVDGVAASGMSGGWTRSFTLPEKQDLILTFKYNLTLSQDFESDEHGEILVSFDGVLKSSTGNDYIHRLAGDGNGGSPTSSGWNTVTLNFGSVDPGSHTLAIGGFLNQKTTASEFAEIHIDDVRLTGTVSPDGGNFGGKTFELKFKHSLKCLDAFNTFPGSNVGQWNCHGGDNQRWRFDHQGAEYYQVVDMRENLCLEIEDGSTDPGANAQIGICGGSGKQLFKPVSVSGSVYTLKNKHSGLLLDVEGASQANGANVIQYPANGQDNQKLVFTEVGSGAPPDTGFVCEGDCLNAESLAPGTNAVLNTTGERWYVVSEDLDGWQASEVAGRTIQVNGITVSPGEMPLPPRMDGDYYFHFSAGDDPWASWGYWNW